MQPETTAAAALVPLVRVKSPAHERAPQTRSAGAATWGTSVAAFPVDQGRGPRLAWSKIDGARWLWPCDDPSGAGPGERMPPATIAPGAQAKSHRVLDRSASRRIERRGSSLRSRQA